MKKTNTDHSEQFLLTKVKTINFCKKPLFSFSFRKFEAYELAMDICENICSKQESEIDYISFATLDNNGILLTITPN